MGQSPTEVLPADSRRPYRADAFTGRKLAVHRQNASSSSLWRSPQRADTFSGLRASCSPAERLFTVTLVMTSETDVESPRPATATATAAS